MSTSHTSFTKSATQQPLGWPHFRTVIPCNKTSRSDAQKLARCVVSFNLCNLHRALIMAKIFMEIELFPSQNMNLALYGEAIDNITVPNECSDLFLKEIICNVLGYISYNTWPKCFSWIFERIYAGTNETQNVSKEVEHVTG